MLKDVTSKAGAAPAKAKQINIRLTAEQDRRLRQHCVRERVSVQEAVLVALKQTIPGL